MARDRSVILYWKYIHETGDKIVVDTVRGVPVHNYDRTALSEQQQNKNHAFFENSTRKSQNVQVN